MLLNISKMKNLKKKKNPLETKFYWAGFLMPTLSTMLV